MDSREASATTLFFVFLRNYSYMVSSSCSLKWSYPRLSNTEQSGDMFKRLLSLSSASQTNALPLPGLKLPVRCLVTKSLAMPPVSIEGFSPSYSRVCATQAVTLVFPQLPVTAIVYF